MPFKNDEQRKAVMANIGKGGSGKRGRKRKWSIHRPTRKAGWKFYGASRKLEEPEVEALRTEFKNRGLDIKVESEDQKSIIYYKPLPKVEPKASPPGPWIRNKAAEDPAVKYWFENDKGGIISFIRPDPSRGSPNPEIRVSPDEDSVGFIIPLFAGSSYESLPPEEILRIAVNHIERDKLVKRAKKKRSK